MTDDDLAALQILWTHDVATYEGPYVAFCSVKTHPSPCDSPIHFISYGMAFNTTDITSSFLIVFVRADILRRQVSSIILTTA